MTTADSAMDDLSAPEHRAQLRRAVIASTIGTTIEWYDFFVYSTVTGLVFPKLYFPESDPLVGTLEAFAIYAVGFVARPVGAAIFGHYGDRIGRRAALIATLLTMGIATFLVAFVPTYDQIGIWGAVILTVLRFIQGVGVGGEWGGSVLLAMEWARTSANRGFIAAWPQFGVPSGLFLGNFAALSMSEIAGDQFLTWGWRVPFFISIVLVGIGLYIRLGVLETPIFARLAAQERLERTPVIEVLRRQPREIALTALARLSEQAPFYIFTAFIFTYGITALHTARDFLLTAVLAASVLSFFAIPSAGHLSDRTRRNTTFNQGGLLKDLSISRADPYSGLKFRASVAGNNVFTIPGAESQGSLRRAYSNASEACCRVIRGARDQSARYRIQQRSFQHALPNRRYVGYRGQADARRYLSLSQRIRAETPEWRSPPLYRHVAQGDADGGALHLMDTEPNTVRKWVLIVEDTPLDMKLFSALLLAEGYEVLEAATGSEGLDLAFEHLPDLIIMDIRLPDISGLEATRILKDDDRTRAIPVLATSAYGQYANKRQIRESGCDGFIPTPIDTGEFVRFVQSFIAAVKEPAHAESSLRVLIGPGTEVREDT